MVKKLSMICGLSLIVLLSACGQSKEEQEREASKRATKAIRSECFLNNPPPSDCPKK